MGSGKSFCIYCGNELEGENRFCPFCGMRLDEQASTQQDQPLYAQQVEGQVAPVYAQQVEGQGTPFYAQQDMYGYAQQDMYGYAQAQEMQPAQPRPTVVAPLGSGARIGAAIVSVVLVPSLYLIYFSLFAGAVLSSETNFADSSGIIRILSSSASLIVSIVLCAVMSALMIILYRKHFGHFVRTFGLDLGLAGAACGFIGVFAEQILFGRDSVFASVFLPAASVFKRISLMIMVFAVVAGVVLICGYYTVKAIGGDRA